MNDLNIDENSLNNLKKMLGKEDFSNLISKISPDMIENVSNIINQNKSSNGNSNSDKFNSNSENNFNMNNIDINTIMKVKSLMDKMNEKDDPRNNLLSSLKPYLRDDKKEKLDQYANLMNIAKISDLFKKEKKENNNG